MVHESDLNNANSKVASISKLMMLIGPSLGGMIMSIMGKNLVIIINSMSFIISLYFILKIRNIDNNYNEIDDIKKSKKVNFNKALITLFSKNKVAVRFVICTAIVNCLFGALNTLFPIISSRYVDNSSVYGYIMTSLGVGLLLGTTLAPKLITRIPLALVYSLATIWGAVLLFFFGVSSHVFVSLILVLGFSLGNGIQEVSSIGFIQTIGKDSTLELFALSQTMTSSLVLISTSVVAITTKLFGINETIVGLSMLICLLGIVMLIRNSKNKRSVVNI